MRFIARYLLWHLCLLTERTHPARQNKTSTSFALLGAFLSPLPPTLTLRAVKRRSFSSKYIWDEFEALTAAMKLSCGCVSTQNEMYTMRVINYCLLNNWFTFVGGRLLTTSDKGFLDSRLSPNYVHFVEWLVEEQKRKASHVLVFKNNRQGSQLSGRSKQMVELCTDRY
jgi:hypothetical protein